MKVGVIGSGGRENAICHSLKKSTKIDKIFCFPGNAGTASIAENIEFELNLRLYELLENTSYLETAYKQVQDTASEMEEAKQFLSYPIPKAIVGEYKRLNKDKN